MKYNIHINQFCWERNNLKSLDIIDLALFDAIKSFMLSSKAETIVSDHQVYYWVSPNLLIAEMPILGITTPRGINKRIDNIIEAGLLERCPSNQSAKRTYFKMGENYNNYNCYNENESSSLGTSVPTPTWNNGSNNNNTIIDNNKENISKDIQENGSVCCGEQNSEGNVFSTKHPNNPLPPSSAAPLPQKKKYADYVSMKEEEYNKLVSEYGELATQEFIKILNNYKGAKGKTYKNDYLAILNWVVDRYKEKHPNITTQVKRPNWMTLGFSSKEEYLKAIQ